MQPPVFVVGCSRSGTTILQSSIAQSESYVSFPETGLPFGFFDGVQYRRYGLVAGPVKTVRGVFAHMVNLSGYVFSEPSKELERMLRAAGREDLVTEVPKTVRTARQSFDVFKALLDEMARPNQWVEKTPQNIFVADRIQRYIPNARFVHIVRNGRENIASLVDAARKYDAFTGRFGGMHGVRRAVAYWNRAALMTRKCINRECHLAIRYEDLVDQPEQVLAHVCKFLKIDFEPEMVLYRPSAVALPQETWKFAQPDRISVKPGKFEGLFSVAEKRFIIKNSIDVDRILPRHSIVLSCE